MKDMMYLMKSRLQKGIKLLFLIIWLPFTMAPKFNKPFGPLPADRTLKSTLCGRLIFLDDIKTGAKLIGLLPCGEGGPYIFNKRPDELHNFYRFHNVVIAKNKNAQIQTSNYGVIYTYIVKFEDYIAITSCGECSGFTSTATPKYRETMIRCSQWIFDKSFNEFDSDIPELEAESIYSTLKDETYLTTVEEKCGVNEDCMEKEISLWLGNELGKIFYNQSVPSQRIILLLKNLIVDPENMQICAPIARLVGYLIIGLNQQGYPINFLEVTSPAMPRLINAQSQQTGVLEDGSVTEEITGTKVVVTSWSVSILYPSNISATVQIEGVGFGSVDIQAIRNNGNEIQDARFEGLLYTQSTRSIFDFLGSQPVLKVDAIGNGNVEARNAESINVYPLIKGWLENPIPTFTITPSVASATLPPVVTQVISPTSSPTVRITSTVIDVQQKEPSLPFTCPSIIGLIFLALAAVFQQRFRFSSWLRQLIS